MYSEHIPKFPLQSLFSSASFSTLAQFYKISDTPKTPLQTKTQIQNVSRQFQDYERSYVDQDQSNLVKQQRQQQQQQQAVASKQQQQDEVKQAADEAAKAAQEAAKAAAEASQSLMKGLGGLFGGGQKQAAKPPKLAQSNQAVMQKKAPDPARLAKPCTYGMSPRQRWQWAFRKIQQVTTTSLKNLFDLTCPYPLPRTALILRTEITILRAGKLSPLFHEVTVI